MSAVKATPSQPAAGLAADLPPEQQRALQLAHRLRAAARAAGVRTHDPLGPLVQAFIETIVHLGIERAASARLAAQVRADVQKAGRATAQGSAKRLAHRAADRIAPHNRMMITIIVAATLIVPAAFGGGWLMGERATRVPSVWRDVLSWNSDTEPLAACQETGNVFVQGGRKFCRILLWIEPMPPQAQ